ncbi:MAG: hypothetical protein R3E10_04005 [Gemmatimonadota bacterium]
MVPVEPITVEVMLPASEFLTSARTAGGFGRTSELIGGDGSRVGFIAHQYSADSLEARTLVRFIPGATSVTVLDTTGASVSDTLLTTLNAFLVGIVDTAASVYEDSVGISVGRVDRIWHGETASWEWAVDSVGAQEPWTEPGAGPVAFLAEGTWVPTVSADTFRIPLDSAALSMVQDSTTRVRGVRLDTRTPGTRLRISNFSIQVEVQPSVNPDTSVVLTSPADDFSGVTFIYDPIPSPTGGELRVGGAPAWRASLSLALPAQLTGPAALCAVVTCPLTLRADELSSAQLLLTTIEGPPAFQPRDSISIGARQLLAPETFPRSPLGDLLTPFAGIRISGPAFSSAPGQTVPVSITPFIQNLIEPDSGTVAVNSLALISPVEPSSLEFMSFAGLGGSGAPVLRLILTVGGKVGIR